MNRFVLLLLFHSWFASSFGSNVIILTKDNFEHEVFSCVQVIMSFRPSVAYSDFFLTALLIFVIRKGY